MAAGISDLFAGFGAAAKAKIVVLGSSPVLMDQLRSLNLEHVSPAQLKGQGISRRPVSAAAQEDATLALMRRWFFARKPDAGFVLIDFPATLLQAKVLDEWLDARDEALNGAVVVQSSPIADHYRTLGLAIEASDLAA